MTEKDELFKGIDDAAENLFNQYIVKKPGGSTPPPALEKQEVPAPPPVVEKQEVPAPPPVVEKQEVPAPPPVVEKQEVPAPEPPPAEIKPEPPAPPPPPVQEKRAEPVPTLDLNADENFAGSEPEIELDFELESETSDLAADIIFDETHEALLTVDWEVTQSNIAKAQDALNKLIADKQLTGDSPASQVAGQMGVVLTSMMDSPENTPVSAPSHLKNALKALRMAFSQGNSPDAETRKMLSSALSDLHTVAAPSPAATAQPVDDESLTLGTIELSEPIITEETLYHQETQSPDIPEPSSDFGLDLELSLESDDQATPGDLVPDETSKVLNTYAASLSTAIKKIAPMEKLFAERSGMEKLHTVSKQLRIKLSGQQKILLNTFSSDFSTYSGIGTVNGWLESQLDVLSPCVKRLAKLEKLFGKTAGYEKLHSLCQKIRSSLAEQQEAITIAVGGTPSEHQFDMTGEYPALQPVLDKPHLPPAPPASAVSAVSDTSAMLSDCILLAQSLEDGKAESPQDAGRELREALVKIKSAISGAALASPGATAAANAAVSAAASGRNARCRWDWLLKSTWGGQLVGFAPEQVVYEGQATLSAKAFRDMAYYRLKKLKSMPWTNLQSIFSGDLAEVDKSTLNTMELEISRPPETFVGSSKKKVYLLIMYIGGKGKVFLLDTPTEAISVAEEALWSPGSAVSDISGTLTVYGSTMPVISID